MDKTRVMFRYIGREVIALFPDVKESNGYILSYMHVGQHSGASQSLEYGRKVSAKKYAPLKAELESIGYNLEVIQ